MSQYGVCGDVSQAFNKIIVISVSRTIPFSTYKVEMRWDQPDSETVNNPVTARFLNQSSGSDLG